MEFWLWPYFVGPHSRITSEEAVVRMMRETQLSASRVISHVDVKRERERGAVRIIAGQKEELVC